MNRDDGSRRMIAAFVVWIGPCSSSPRMARVRYLNVERILAEGRAAHDERRISNCEHVPSC